MDMYLAANAYANGYAKMCPFPSWLLKWHALFPSVSYGSWNLTQAASCLHPPALPIIISETLHLCLPLTLFPTVSFILFLSTPVFQFYDVPPLNYIEDTSSVATD